MADKAQPSDGRNWWEQTLRNISEANHQLARRAVVYTRWLNGLTSIVFPTLEAISVRFSLWIILGCIGVIHLLLFVWMTKFMDDVHETTRSINPREFLDRKREFEQLCSEKKQFEEIIGMHVSRITALCSSVSLLRRLSYSTTSDDHRGATFVQGALEQLLGPLIQHRSRVLRYKGDDLYNFAVYMYNKEKDLLEIVFRDCDNRIVRHDRSWKPGRGHVGYAFANCETIISSDTRTDSMFQAVDGYDSDKEYYVSFVSSPILDPACSESDKEKRALGVFVVTSSRPGHLTKEDRQFIDTYSQLLAIFFLCSANRKEDSHGTQHQYGSTDGRSKEAEQQ